MSQAHEIKVTTTDASFDTRQIRGGVVYIDDDKEFLIVEYKIPASNDPHGKELEEHRVVVPMSKVLAFALGMRGFVYYQEKRHTSEEGVTYAGTVFKGSVDAPKGFLMMGAIEPGELKDKVIFIRESNMEMVGGYCFPDTSNEVLPC